MKSLEVLICLAFHLLPGKKLAPSLRLNQSERSIIGWMSTTYRTSIKPSVGHKWREFSSNTLRENNVSLSYPFSVELNMSFDCRGVPQIQVTFEVDADGILQVKAEDKAPKKSESITITADKGRHSAEEIERLVREAEESEDEDKMVRDRAEARNQLESYIYNMRNTINDKDKLADKIDPDDKERIESALKEGLEWLEDNQNAEKADFDEKLKEVDAVCNPVIRQVYERSGGSSASSEDEEFHDEL